MEVARCRRATLLHGSVHVLRDRIQVVGREKIMPVTKNFLIVSKFVGGDG